MNYVKAIPTFLKSQECEWGVKAATHALVTGYTANEAVRFVNVLKSSEFLPKAVSTLNARYVEIAGMLTGVGVAIYTAYCSYAKESDLAAATASSKKAEPTKPFATRWLEAKADLKTAVRWAAVALFVPAVFDGIQQQMTQVPALTRFFKALGAATPTVQYVFNAATSLGALPTAALTFSTIVATRIIGPFSANAERTPKETTYQQKFDFVRVLWEAPLAITLTHLTLNALNMPVSSALSDSIKYSAILATLADSLLAGAAHRP